MNEQPPAVLARPKLDAMMQMLLSASEDIDEMAKRTGPSRFPSVEQLRGWRRMVDSIMAALNEASLAQQGEAVLWVSPDSLRGAIVAANAGRPTAHWAMAWNCEMVSACATVPLFTRPAAVANVTKADFMKAVSIELMLTFADNSASAARAYTAINKVATAALLPATSEVSGNE